MHAREQIRDAFITALSSISATVIDGRVFPVYDEILPSVIVTTREENVDPEAAGSDSFQVRILNVKLEVYAKSEGVVDDALDSIAVEIETKVFADAGIKALVRCLDYINMTTDTSGEGENAMAIMSITFTAQYLTEKGSPEIII